MRTVVAVLLAFGLGVQAQQPQPPAPPPPPPPPPKPLRIEDVSRKLARTQAANETAKAALVQARDFLRSAKEAERKQRAFVAGRYAAAADAMIRIAEHQQHLAPAGGPGRPQVAHHLERAYFRLQQANYFLAQSHDASARNLPALGRGFYEDGVKAFDAGNYAAADEWAKCVEDTVAALENLAQAATPVPPPPPPRRP
ncbi:MAG TPA: hypothetical protein VFB14_00630 [Bryobacteraceae bacterium]|nr:hypothetical protein [Bryobacteraceae bacterium]